MEVVRHGKYKSASTISLLLGWIISSIGKRLKRHSARIQKEQGDFLSIIDETVNGQKIIKTF